MYTLLKDIRYGFRVLRRAPAFSALALITLVLGIGANSLIFTIVNALSFHGPFKDSDDVVVLRNQYSNVAPMSTSLPDFQTWRTQAQSFSKMAGYFLTNYTLSGRTEPERVRAALISRDYFELFGARPRLGRFFSDSEQQKGGSPVCLISEQMWKQEFGSELSIFSKSLTLDGKSYQVVGIVPAEAPDFRSMPKTDVWLPLEAMPPWEAEDVNFVWTVGKLKPNVSIEAARRDIEFVQNRLNTQFPGNQHQVNIISVPDFLLGSAKRALTVLLIAVAFVLLIACANVANMLLARATGRVKELAVREALGANRTRLVRQLLTENLILTTLAAGLALLFASIFSGIMVRLWPAGLRRPEVVELDWHVLAFTAGIAFVSAMLFGLAPALRISRLNINRTLRESQGLQATGGPGSNFLRNGFVVSEIAFATVLLIAAVFTMRSFARLLEIDHGFDTKNLLTFRINLPERKYAKPEQRSQFFDELTIRMRSLPGITAVSASSFLPFSSGQTAAFDVKDRVYDQAKRPWAERHFVTPDYFETMRLPLVSGRFINDRDRDNSAKVAMVSQTTAKQIWPGEDPVGKLVSINADSNEWQQVVGVVGDIKGTNPEAAPRMQIYIPMLQAPTASMTIIARTTMDLRSAIDSSKATVLSMDPDQPLANVATMDEILENSLSGTRYSTFLLGLFSSLAMILAVLGVYGVMAYSVTQRSHEFGIRIALGAQRSSIMRMVMGNGLRLVVYGTVAGLVLSFVVAPMLRSLLFDETTKGSADMGTYGIVVMLLSAGAVMASYLPAYRATKSDPMMMLRHD
jgi:putative ABC transport system permease protein